MSGEGVLSAGPALPVGGEWQAVEAGGCAPPVLVPRDPALADALEKAVTQVLQNDPVCGGRVAGAAIREIARLLIIPEPPAGPDLPDVVAYLEQRRDNANVIAKRQPELEPWAADRRQQLEVIIGDLGAGLHKGSAAVRAALKQTEEQSDGA